MDLNDYLGILRDCQDPNVLKGEHRIYDQISIIFKAEDSNFAECVNSLVSDLGNNYTLEKIIDMSNEAIRKRLKEDCVLKNIEYEAIESSLHVFHSDENLNVWEARILFIPEDVELRVGNHVTLYRTTGFGANYMDDGTLNPTSKEQMKKYNNYIEFTTKTLDDASVLAIAKTELDLLKRFVDKKIPFCITHTKEPIENIPSQ